MDVDLAAGTATAEAGDDTLDRIENLWGTGKNDLLRGDDGENHISAGAGDDVLVGRAGVDLLDGGPGTDQCEDDPAELQGCETASAAGRDPATPIVWRTWLLRGRDIPPRG